MGRKVATSPEKIHLDGQNFCIILALHMIFRSIVEGCLIAGGTSSREGRQACLFTAVHPMNSPMLTPRFTENEPRMIPNALSWLDLRFAHGKGLFFHSKSNAILLYGTMPTESLVKVVQRKNMTHKARFFTQRRIKFEKKFVISA